MIPPRLIPSCAAALPAMPHSPYAAATPMFEAAGIVVTETRTPTRAPDFAAVSDRTPAEPATKATKKLRKVGSVMKSVNGWRVSSKLSGNSPIHTMNSVVARAARVPRGNPTARAITERRASAAWRWTRATEMAASGPNSGPRTMAPTIRIGSSSTIPTAAICIAATMNSTKLKDSSVCSDVRASTSSHTTASDGRPGAAFSAAVAASEIAVSICSTAIDPPSGCRAPSGR